MKKLLKRIVPVLIISMFLSGCEKNNPIENYSIQADFEYLKGTWIDQESFALQFLDFYSENQARFGIYGKNFEKYDSVNYRITDAHQLAIDFLGDNDQGETLLGLKRVDDETIEISNLTVIPENPDKIYLKRELITEKVNDTIVIGYKQIYFDFENHFRLQMDSVKNDSRCPIGVNCVWEGNAEIYLDLIMEGNYRYVIILNTNNSFQTNTLVRNINFEIAGLIPYPEINKPIDKKDYKVKILAKKQ
jgi:hypothetical protein